MNARITKAKTNGCKVNHLNLIVPPSFDVHDGCTLTPKDLGRNERAPDGDAQRLRGSGTNALVVSW